MIRQLPDGSMMIPRFDAVTVAHLDRTYPRVPGGELRWWNRPLSACISVAELRERFAGRRAVVLGKGPSLERIREVSIYDADLVAAVNESALAKGVPRVDLALAVDPPVVKTLAKLREGPLLLTDPGCAELTERATALSDLWDSRLRPNSGCSPALLRLLRRVGVSELVMVGFDGFDAPTRGATYAGTILALGVKDRGNGDFGSINEMIRAEIDGWEVPITWLHREPKPRVPKGG